MSASDRGIRISRVALMLLMVAVPILGPGSSLILILFAAAITSYDGLQRSTVYGITGTLIGLELLFGMNVGVLSLSYIMAVGVLLLTSRVISIPSWRLARGWNIGDAIRALVIACVLASFMSVSTALVGHLLYDYADVRARIQAFCFSRSTAVIPIGIACVLLVLRRIDEPFRRRIIFGT